MDGPLNLSEDLNEVRFIRKYESNSLIEERIRSSVNIAINKKY